MWRTLLAVLAVWAGDAVAQPAPAARASLAALRAKSRTVAREVAAIRGLPLKHEIAVEVVEPDELRARLARRASPATHTAGIALARWGLIPQGVDYAQALIDARVDQLGGYYDPATKHLVIVRGAADDPAVAGRLLARELDRGLQDQAFDLRALEAVPDGDDDEALARRALIAGDSRVAMDEVLLARAHIAAPWSDPAVAQRAVATLDPAGDALDRAPFVVREQLRFPERAGLAFVAAIRRRHAWSAVDAVFRRPPRSTEQILHPDKYAADERPIPVAASLPPALAGFALAHQTVWGELGFQLFLRGHRVSDAQAVEAAAGWGGDRVVLLERPGDARADHAIGLARFAWDTEIDAIEAEEAAVKALDDAIVGARVEHDDTHVVWLALDGTMAFVERRGTSLVMAIGVPAWAAADLRVQAWTALTEGHPSK